MKSPFPIDDTDDYNFSYYSHSLYVYIIHYYPNIMILPLV